MDIVSLQARASVHRLYRNLASKFALTIHQTHRCVYMLYQRDLLPNNRVFSNLLSAVKFDTHTKPTPWQAYNALGPVAHVKYFNLSQCTHAERYLNDLIAMNLERFTTYCLEKGIAVHEPSQDKSSVPSTSFTINASHALTTQQPASQSAVQPNAQALNIHHAPHTLALSAELPVTSRFAILSLNSEDNMTQETPASDAKDADSTPPYLTTIIPTQPASHCTDSRHSSRRNKKGRNTTSHAEHDASDHQRTENLQESLATHTHQSQYHSVNTSVQRIATASEQHIPVRDAISIAVYAAEIGDIDLLKELLHTVNEPKALLTSLCHASKALIINIALEFGQIEYVNTILDAIRRHYGNEASHAFDHIPAHASSKKTITHANRIRVRISDGRRHPLITALYFMTTQYQASAVFSSLTVSMFDAFILPASYYPDMQRILAQSIRTLGCQPGGMKVIQPLLYKLVSIRAPYFLHRRHNNMHLTNKNIEQNPTAEYFLRGLKLIDALETTTIHKDDIHNHLTAKFAHDPNWVCMVGDALFKTVWDNFILYQFTFCCTQYEQKHNPLATELQTSLCYLIQLLDRMCAYPSEYQKTSKKYLQSIIRYINEADSDSEQQLSKSIRHALLTSGPYTCPVECASLFSVFASGHKHSKPHHQNLGLYWGDSQQFSNCLMVFFALRERQEALITDEEHRLFINSLKENHHSSVFFYGTMLYMVSKNTWYLERVIEHTQHLHRIDRAVVMYLPLLQRLSVHIRKAALCKNPYDASLSPTTTFEFFKWLIATLSADNSKLMHINDPKDTDEIDPYMHIETSNRKLSETFTAISNAIKKITTWKLQVIVRKLKTRMFLVTSQASQHANLCASISHTISTHLDRNSLFALSLVAKQPCIYTLHP